MASKRPTKRKKRREWEIHVSPLGYHIHGYNDCLKKFGHVIEVGPYECEIVKVIEKHKSCREA